MMQHPLPHLATMKATTDRPDHCPSLRTTMFSVLEPPCSIATGMAKAVPPGGVLKHVPEQLATELFPFADTDMISLSAATWPVSVKLL